MTYATSGPGCYIDGAWVDGTGPEMTSTNPSTEEALYAATSAGTEQVEAALAAAHREFHGGAWRALTGAERAQLLRKLADLMERDADELMGLIAREVGTAISTAQQQVLSPIAFTRWFADAAERGPADGLEQQLPLHYVPVTTSSMLLREPIGVVAAIAAYNYPIMLIVWKVCAALAAGCTSVLVPSPKGIACTVAIVRLMDEAGFPPGAVNLVFGGPEVTEQVVGSRAIDMATFTGSAAVGTIIQQLAAPNLTKVVLELGGKSPNLILPGTDIDSTIAGSALRFCANAGQACGATTRTLVPRTDFDEFVKKSAEYMDGLVVGDASDPKTFVGPLISEEHLQRVEGYVQRAVDAGATIAVGGKRAEGLSHGHFYAPTLVTGVDNSSEIAQEELFAPVAVVLPYDEVDEAVELANDSRYALNANIWGTTVDAIDVARRLRSGTVTINGGGGRRLDAPWGGPGHSGIGRECGEEGYREFFEVKHVQWPIR
ncbi:aldehyde dehydrogenase family protein [Gordonia sp. X0973]|uniref:aldehyde dehydrogenase family protein n=1 Tax=Gordonia sp. X0973 TaxID=2742602 RepID=UPI000F5248B1|nr:aldehyde dehydrogenase family protein [Gordonia sp. X0973]QKT08788.1 aldehyde dehydrogenase family protein [Gordonia sp. X0973]